MGVSEANGQCLSKDVRRDLEHVNSSLKKNCIDELWVFHDVVHSILIHRRVPLEHISSRNLIAIETHEPVICSIVPKLVSDVSNFNPFKGLSGLRVSNRNDEGMRSQVSRL